MPGRPTIAAGHTARPPSARIRRSIACYADFYRDEAGWDWTQSTREAARYLSAIEDFSPAYAEELMGIADGAGVEAIDILTINIRTEVMNAARMRSVGQFAAPSECSAFAAVAGNGHVIAGQNWDWAPFALDTVVVLRAEPDDGPAYVTVVEAGLLAKFGANSSGLAVMTNALTCSDDVGDVGLPYHVVLRALFDCDSTQAGLDLLRAVTRASSANYLLADSSRHLVDVEARPGGEDAIHELSPDSSGCLLHTNHFVAADFPALDYTTMVESTSRTRLAQIASMVSMPDGTRDLSTYDSALVDHTNAPDSVCRHVDPTEPLNDQSVTVAAALVDLTEPRLLVAAGPPCEKGFRPIPTPW